MSQIDKPYYAWLISQIEFPSNGNGKKSFDDLLHRLHETEFTWTISGDDNRVQDALDLRTEYGHMRPNAKFKEYVSILEIMIAISRILEFVAGGKAQGWVWRLIENLKLNHCYDPFDEKKSKKVNEILDRLIWRTYKPNGQGGFFPLLFPREDQTKVEIWYQLNAYVNEIVES